MIKSFKHKGLERYFVEDVKKFLNERDLKKIERILDRLDTAALVEDMNIPGWRFHSLRDNRAGEWSVRIRDNWRITFKFVAGDAYDVNIEDYH